MDDRFLEANEKFDEMWTRTAAAFRVVSFPLITAVLICAAGAGLLLAGIAAIYRPAALIAAGLMLVYVAFVISTRVEGDS